MRIAIMSRSKKIYSTNRLVEAGRERGHEMHVVDTARCYMNIASHRPTMHFRGEQLEPFDAVIPRIGASITFYGTAVLRQFEMMGTFPLNESVAVTRSRDKTAIAAIAGPPRHRLAGHRLRPRARRHRRPD